MDKGKLALKIFGWILLTLSISACSAPNRTNYADAQDAALSAGELDSSPAEDVIKTYLAGLRDQDFDQMLGTFDLEGFRDTGSYGETQPGLSALPEAFLQEAAVVEREGEIAEDILRQYLVLCQRGTDGGGEGQPDPLSEQIGAADFSSLKVLGFISRESLIDAAGSDTYEKYTAAQAKRFGMDQLGVFMPVIELGGKKYSLIFEAAGRDGRWSIMRLGGFYAAMAGLDADAAGAALLDQEDEMRLDQLLLPAGDLPREAGVSEAEGRPPGGPEGFDTPEMAAEAYLERFQSYDLAGMLDVFTMETAGFSQREVPIPAQDDFARDMNIRIRKAEIREDIFRQYSALAMMESFFNGGHEDAQTAAGKELDLKSLKALGPVPPETLSEAYGTEGSRNLMAKQAERAGAGRMESCAVTFEVEGCKYVFSADAAEYGGRWYINQLGGHLAGLCGVSSEFMGIWPLSGQEGADTPQTGANGVIGEP